jgi:hypothetical protein
MLCQFCQGPQLDAICPVSGAKRIRTNSWAAESAPKPSDKSEDKSGKPAGKPAGKGTKAVSFPIREHIPLTPTLREQVYQSGRCS